MKKSSKKIDAAHVAAMVLGGAAGAKLSNVALPVIPDKFRPLVPVVGGYLLTRSKNKMIVGIGQGMIVVGAVKAVGSFVPALGISEMPYALSEYVINGTEDPTLIGRPGLGRPGMGQPAALAGMEGLDNGNEDKY
jgi:hypothetical protein